MSWEFIGKAEVSMATNDKFKRAMLTIGIVCFLFVMVVEFIIGNKGAWFFVVPLFYLLSLKNQISGKNIILDVPMNVTIKESDVEIIFNNTIRNKEGVFSEKYNFKIFDIEKCNYLRNNRQLQILTNCQYCKLGESLVEMGKTRRRNISFKLAKEVEEELMCELNKRIVIDYFE